MRYPLETMIKQTIKPLKWVIVDDGSTDNTASLIKAKADRHEWIEYLYNQKKTGQIYYSSNVYAILKGISAVNYLPYNYLAILDADIELCDNYYESIFKKFSQYESLGIATGTYLELEGRDWVMAKIDRKSTPKAIQVFRRDCYEYAGGYIPFKYGGEDSGMEVMARMSGWKTWSFDSIVVKHHRPVGTGGGRSLLRARFGLGITEYCLGTHPFYIILKSIKRMFWEKPYCISGLTRLMGYIYGYLRRLERQLPDAGIQYLREEQIRRLLKKSSENWSLE